MRTVDLCPIFYILHSQVQIVVFALYVAVFVQKLYEKGLAVIPKIVFNDCASLLASFGEAQDLFGT